MKAHASVPRRTARKTAENQPTIRIDGITFSIGLPWCCPHCGGQIQRGLRPIAFPDRKHPAIAAIYAKPGAADSFDELMRLEAKAVSRWLATAAGKAYLRKAATIPGSPYSRGAK